MLPGAAAAEMEANGQSEEAAGMVRELISKVNANGIATALLAHRALHYVLNSQLKEETPEALAEAGPHGAALADALADLQRALLRHVEQEISAVFLVSIVDNTLGACLMLQRPGLWDLLMDAMTDAPQNTRTSNALTVYCNLLHPPTTRDAFAQRTAESPLLQRLLAVLQSTTRAAEVAVAARRAALEHAEGGRNLGEGAAPAREEGRGNLLFFVPGNAPAANPNDALAPQMTRYEHLSLLALNWFGGSAIGARLLVPHVPDIVAAVASSRWRPGRHVMLLLTLANIPAYVEDDRAVCEAMVAHGALPTLIACARTRRVEEGSVGALMGLLNLRAHLGPDPAYTVGADDLSTLTACMLCALSSESHGNILWSPNHPAQAIANLARLPSAAPLIAQAGLVDMLIEAMRGQATGTQAEPERDELYAARALRILAQRSNLKQMAPHAIDHLQWAASEGRTPAARDEAAQALEACMVPGPSMLSLSTLCRRALRRSYGPGFDAYSAKINELDLSSGLRQFLLYDLS
jgi:hypothetical protein